MPVGAPGASSRGRGGKHNKPTRGGGKHFSRDLQPVDADGNHVSMWSAEARDKKSGKADDESEEEESSEEESGDEDAGAADAEDSREARKALKKARKEAAIAKQKSHSVEVGDMPSSEEDSDDDDEDMPANPNHSKAARNQTKAPTVAEITEGVAGLPAPAPGSRKEREAVEAAAAKERYMKMHAAGKTDEAKADLARLKLIREQRAAEGARRQAEKEEREEQEKTRKAEIEAKEAKKREAAAGPKKVSKKSK